MRVAQLAGSGRRFVWHVFWNNNNNNNNNNCCCCDGNHKLYKFNNNNNSNRKRNRNDNRNDNHRWRIWRNNDVDDCDNDVFFHYFYHC